MNMEAKPKKEVDWESDFDLEEDMRWKEYAEIPDELKQMLKRRQLD